MAVHDVSFTIPERGLGKADVKFALRQNAAVLGTLAVSNGSVVWFPKGTTYDCKMSRGLRLVPPRSGHHRDSRRPDFWRNMAGLGRGTRLRLCRQPRRALHSAAGSTPEDSRIGRGRGLKISAICVVAKVSHRRMQLVLAVRVSAGEQMD